MENDDESEDAGLAESPWLPLSSRVDRVEEGDGSSVDNSHSYRDGGVE